MRYMGAWGIVDFAEDAWDATGGKVVDLASNVFEALPVSGPLKDLVNGPLRDFANTAVGKTVLRAVASSFFGPLSWHIGPQLASVAWALPGLFRGEPFEKAWFDEVKWRTEKTAEILAPGAFEGAGFEDLFGKMWAEFLPGVDILESARELADRFGVREDLAAYAKALWNRVSPDALYALRDRFDIVTGREMMGGRGSELFDVSQLQTTVSGRAAGAYAAQFAVSNFEAGDIPSVVSGAAARAASQGFGIGVPDLDAFAPAPVAVAVSAPSSAERNKKIGDVVLAGTVVAAVGALVWYFGWEKSERR
jgi:hypothetical protein